MTLPTRPEHVRRSALALLASLSLTTASGGTAPAAVTAAAPKSLDQVCALTVCRPPTRVRLDMGPNRYYVVDQPKAPYVYQGVVNVLANETVVSLVHLDGDRIDGLSYVAEPGKIAPVIVSHLESYVDEKGERSMLLTVTNPFDRPIRYTARIQRAGKNTFEDEHTCPVPPHRAGAETWPFYLVQVLLRDFRFVGKDEPVDKGCTDR